MKSPSKFIAVALLFVALVLINYIASTLPVRLDATAGKIYSVSPGTRAILAKIEEPVVLDFYWSQSASSPEVSYKDFAARVGELLRQYVRAAHGRLILHVIDPQPDTPAEEQAVASGVTAQVWPGTNEKFYFGLVATQADQKKIITTFVPERESFLEYDLSALIYSVQQVDKKRLGLLTNLPLQGSRQNQITMQISPDPQFIVSEWEKSLSIESIDPTAETLPRHLDALAIIHPPKYLKPELRYAIDQYLLSGRPVFLALDPSSVYFKTRESRIYGDAMPDLTSDLPKLLRAYGISYDPTMITADVVNAAKIQTDSGIVVRYPAWLALSKPSFNAKALPTAQLDSMALIEPGSFTVKPNPGLTVTPLIESGPKSGEVPVYALQTIPPDELAQHVTPTGKKLIAALITGKFKTAFPDGDPAAKIPGAKLPPAPPLKESARPSTLLFIADTDWLLDHFSVRVFSVMGQPAAQPLNDNLAFGANAMDYLCGSQDLVSIRGKGASERPFTVVRKMEAAAEEKSRHELDAIDARLNDVQKKLTDLQAETGDGRSLLSSPVMQQSIDDFKKQEAVIQHQRRQIRLALREGIDALGNRLLAFNLLTMPVCVGLFGLWFSRHRRR